MSRIYWDSMLFIYWLEDHPAHAPRIQQILQQMTERGDILCTSTFTLGELLTGPYKRGDRELAARVRGAFEASMIQTLAFTTATADLYASIRAQHGFSPADTIHLASAAEVKTDVFLTNDNALLGKIVAGIQFITNLETNLF